MSNWGMSRVSQHILSYDMVNDIVERLKPKVIIPTYYLNESTTYTLSTLAPADGWVKAQKSYRMLDSAVLDLPAAEVAGMDREFLYFGANVVTARLRRDDDVMTDTGAVCHYQYT